MALPSSGWGRCPAARCRSSGSGTAACSGGPGCRRCCVTELGCSDVRFGRRCVERLVDARQQRAGGHRWCWRCRVGAVADVRVGGQLGDRERVRLLAAPLAQRVAAAHVDRRPAPQVGQGEVHPAVAAEGRTQQREERLVLVDGQELPVAQGPRPWARTRRTSAGSRTRTARPCRSLLSFRGAELNSAPLFEAGGHSGPPPPPSPLRGRTAASIEGDRIRRVREEADLVAVVGGGQGRCARLGHPEAGPGRVVELEGDVEVEERRRIGAGEVVA